MRSPLATITLGLCLSIALLGCKMQQKFRCNRKRCKFHEFRKRANRSGSGLLGTVYRFGHEAQARGSPTRRSPGGHRANRTLGRSCGIEDQPTWPGFFADPG